ncbi:MAG: DUF1566 domain-containing protein [Rubrivivax sp.]|nr:DUF1566 domain-containing protein [Rubrivivax sp.]
MDDIFISYRRDDARADAGRLHDRLAAHFGHRHVFMDVDDIAPGEDFAQRLETTLAGCSAVIVVIGRQWLGVDAPTGVARIADPQDFVHREVAAALARGVPVFPVLVGGAALPARDQLPEALVPLLARQAVEVRDTRFSDDVAQLVDALAVAAGRRRGRLSRRPLMAALGAAVLLGAAAAVYLMRRGGAPALSATPALLTGAEVDAMLVRHDFYDARRNAAARGSAARLEPLASGSDVVVIDHGTGLMWQKGASDGPRVFADADAVVRALNASAYAGHRDWRLPTLAEAMSLTRQDVAAGAHIDAAFDAGAAPFTWTADRAPPDRGWVVYYYDGLCAPESLRFNAYVRAVRTQVQ